MQIAFFGVYNFVALIGDKSSKAEFRGRQHIYSFCKYHSTVISQESLQPSLPFIVTRLGFGRRGKVSKNRKYTTDRPL